MENITNTLLNKCSQVYAQLVDIYENRTDLRYEVAAKKMVELVEGKATTKANVNSFGNDVLTVNWIIRKPVPKYQSDKYDGRNFIISDSRGDWYRFIEDLTSAYYSTNGGTEYNTPSLIKALGCS